MADMCALACIELHTWHRENLRSFQNVDTHPPPSRRPGITALPGNFGPMLDTFLKPGQALTGTLTLPPTKVQAPKVPHEPHWNKVQSVVKPAGPHITAGYTC